MDNHATNSSSSLTRVLCVEDNADVREIVCSTVDAESDMHCVACLSKADRLVEMVEQHQPDVIVYDLTMPGRDALDALRELNQRFPHTPVIAFSAYDDVAHKSAAIDAGAWSFLSKHGDFQLLVQSIRRLALVKSGLEVQRSRESASAE